MILKPIEEFPGYSVSSDGWIQSDYRYVISKGRPKEIKARILRPALTGQGYLFVTLRRDGKAFNVRIHKAVATAFLGPSENGLVINHKDHNKLNNKADNLEYTSRQTNTQEYYKFIGKRKGSIPISHIKGILHRINRGESVVKIAEEYNVSRNDLATVTRVIALTGEELTIKE